MYRIDNGWLRRPHAHFDNERRFFENRADGPFTCVVHKHTYYSQPFTKRLLLASELELHQPHRFTLDRNSISFRIHIQFPNHADLAPASFEISIHLWYVLLSTSSSFYETNNFSSYC